MTAEVGGGGLEEMELEEGTIADLVKRFGDGASVTAIAMATGVSERRVARAIRLRGGEDLWRPRCMDDADYQLWRTSGVDRNVARPCFDCPPSFAAEMAAVGRCNGTPRGKELPSEEDHVAQDLTRVDVASQVPCGRCAHSPVCSIKSAVLALHQLDVALPELPSPVKVVLTADVECSMFLRAKNAGGGRRGRPPGSGRPNSVPPRPSA